MPKVDAFTASVTKARKAADAKAIASALGDLVLVRRHAKVARPTSFVDRVHNAQSAYPTIGKRRSARRIGRVKAYTPTTKPDYSRPGTFRHYMIKTIREHSNTLAANDAHSTCTEPSYAKNRLDFNWAADNGYINWA